MGKLFKTGLFGFKKKPVMEYIDSLAGNYSKELGEKEQQLEKLQEENKTLRARLTETEKKLGTMENERDYIANAIIRAEQEAQNLLEAAKKDVDVRKAELERSVEEDAERARQTRQELRDLQSAALETIRQYEAKLEQLAGEQ